MKTSGARPQGDPLEGDSCPAAGPGRIFLLSDGTGSTVSQVLRAALLQFEGVEVQVTRRDGVRSAGELHDVAAEAGRVGALVLYTLVDPALNQLARHVFEELLVPSVDLMGPVLAGLTELLKSSPRADPTLLYEIERGHADRVDAVDFTIQHDDGQRIAEIDHAEVVLVGVSRVSKSVTCFALAFRGIRTANVPLGGGLEPPPELLAVDPRKVILLTMSVQRLRLVRECRMEHMRMGPLEGYVDPRSISGELHQAMGLAKRHGWRTIDVSYHAVEEVAREVLIMMGRYGPLAPLLAGG